MAEMSKENDKGGGSPPLENLSSSDKSGQAAGNSPPDPATQNNTSSQESKDSKNTQGSGSYASVASQKKLAKDIFSDNVRLYFTTETLPGFQKERKDNTISRVRHLLFKCLPKKEALLNYKFWKYQDSYIWRLHIFHFVAKSKIDNFVHQARSLFQANFYKASKYDIPKPIQPLSEDFRQPNNKQFRSRFVRILDDRNAVMSSEVEDEAIFQTLFEFLQWMNVDCNDVSVATFEVEDMIQEVIRITFPSDCILDKLRTKEIFEGRTLLFALSISSLPHLRNAKVIPLDKELWLKEKVPEKKVEQKKDEVVEKVDIHPVDGKNTGLYTDDNLGKSTEDNSNKNPDETVETNATKTSPAQEENRTPKANNNNEVRDSVDVNDKNILQESNIITTKVPDVEEGEILENNTPSKTSTVVEEKEDKVDSATEDVPQDDVHDMDCQEETPHKTNKRKSEEISPKQSEPKKGGVVTRSKARAKLMKSTEGVERGVSKFHD
jgi:hypothetical protein